MLLRPLLLAATTGFRTPHTATTGLRPLRLSHIHSCAATTYPATKALYLEDASLLEATRRCLVLSTARLTVGRPCLTRQYSIRREAANRPTAASSATRR